MSAMSKTINTYTSKILENNIKIYSHSKPKPSIVPVTNPAQIVATINEDKANEPMI